MTNWSHGYRNRPEPKPRPPMNQKIQVVKIGNLTVVFLRDAQIVTMRWEHDGKTYSQRLRPWSPNWRRAVKEARKVVMRQKR